MKKATVFIITLLLATTVSHAQWGKKKIKGNGKVTTITRSTSDYDAVKVAGFFDVELVAGTEGNITLKGESNLLEYVMTEVDGDVLKIKTKKGYNLRTSKRQSLVITVPFQDISKVSLSGSGDVYTKDTIKADSFGMALAGSGDVIIDVETGKLKMAVSGSGDMTATGTADNAEIALSGSGDIHAYKLTAKSAKVSLAGSGDIRVHATDYLKARVAGSGDITYKGKPAKQDTKVAGSGSISMN
ncbi:putative auto-transporter adhesin, head GIN domain [Kordia sp. SMS9]|uniref:head GIN domain-containing protein n=1 Tax=Kordia sp. SMS9 TaxID=2282170 RepID=UPI000E0D4676|nr:head GIN domain-containing protein [Kordia sp. SMS9]AXG72033.1 putative auto-transporter adhesin, head GIN domain [Kordia sp. SMS9]